uniref:Uncharacterized protein n=1 Tax=Amphiprion percula TaxID=161767 RepID=A0A3P8RVY4_AMPPE
MTNYCHHWIYDYATMESVLRAATLQDANPAVQWTESMLKTFVDLKTSLVSAPALGLPDYMQPFYLYVIEKEGFASGMLVHGMPGCLRSVAAVVALIEKSSPLVSLLLLSLQDIEKK